MLLVFGIAGAAAALVILYNKLRSENPDAAALTSRRVQQLAAVVLVLSKAVEGVVEALQAGVRPQMATSSWGPQPPPSSWSPQPRPLVDVWEDFDDDG